jgi:hypothetical protein
MSSRALGGALKPPSALHNQGELRRLIRKRLIIVPVYNIVIARDLALIFITYIMRYVDLPNLITFNRGL